MRRGVVEQLGGHLAARQGQTPALSNRFFWKCCDGIYSGWMHFYTCIDCDKAKKWKFILVQILCLLSVFQWHLPDYSVVGQKLEELPERAPLIFMNYIISSILLPGFEIVLRSLNLWYNPEINCESNQLISSRRRSTTLEHWGPSLMLLRRCLCQVVSDLRLLERIWEQIRDHLAQWWNGWWFFGGFLKWFLP